MKTTKSLASFHPFRAYRVFELSKTKIIAHLLFTVLSIVFCYYLANNWSPEDYFIYKINMKSLGLNLQQIILTCTILCILWTTASAIPDNWTPMRPILRGISILLILAFLSLIIFPMSFNWSEQSLLQRDLFLCRQALYVLSSLYWLTTFALPIKLKHLLFSYLRLILTISLAPLVLIPVSWIFIEKLGATFAIVFLPWWIPLVLLSIFVNEYSLLVSKMERV